MEGWKKQNLSNVCKVFTDGDWIQTKDQSSDGIRLIQTGNIGIGVFKNRKEKARYISENTFSKLNCTEVLPNDCLISRLPDPVGRSCIISETGSKMITAVDCTIVRFDEDIISPKYFNYYSQSQCYLKSISSYCTGATRKRISRKNLGKIPIPLPPLSDQERIVSILDEAFAAIETATKNTEKNIQNAKELFEAKLRNLFEIGNTWPKRLLKNVSKEYGRGRSRHRPRNAQHLYGGKHPFIQTGDIRNSKHLIEKYYQTYSEEGLQQSKKWPKGTVCITIAANIAETGILNFDACFPDSVIGIVADENQLDCEYLEYILQAYKQVIKTHGKGSAQDNINLGTFEKVPFPIPSLNVQKEQVCMLSSLDRYIQDMNKRFEKKQVQISELKQSLLHQAFTGQLTGKSAVSVSKPEAAPERVEKSKKTKQYRSGIKSEMLQSDSFEGNQEGQ